MTNDDLAARFSKLKFGGKKSRTQSSTVPYSKDITIEGSNADVISEDNDLFNRFQSLSNQNVEAVDDSALHEDLPALDDEDEVQKILIMAQDAVRLEEKYPGTESKVEATENTSEDDVYDNSGNSTDSSEASMRNTKVQLKREMSGINSLSLPSVPSEDPDTLSRRNRAKDALKSLAEEGCSMCGKDVDLLCLDCRKDQDDSFLYCRGCFEITHHGDNSLFKHSSHKTLPFSKFE